MPLKLVNNGSIHAQRDHADDDIHALRSCTQKGHTCPTVTNICGTLMMIEEGCQTHTQRDKDNLVVVVVVAAGRSDYWRREKKNEKTKR